MRMGRDKPRGVRCVGLCGTPQINDRSRDCTIASAPTFAAEQGGASSAFVVSGDACASPCGVADPSSPLPPARTAHDTRKAVVCVTARHTRPTRDSSSFSSIHSTIPTPSTLATSSSSVFCQAPRHEWAFLKNPPDCSSLPATSIAPAKSRTDELKGREGGGQRREGGGRRREGGGRRARWPG